MFRKHIFIFLIFLGGISLSAYAAPIPFTVNLSENVVVTGSPRLQLDIGGVTRYAPYASGSGTNALSFAYPVVAPDFDRNGITLVSPLDLNGGTIRDLNGNDANLTFTAPNSSGVLVQSYTVDWTTSSITNLNASATAFSIEGAPTGATYNYSISSSGGAGAVTGSGSIAGSPQAISGVDISGLPSGTLTLGVTITNASGTGNQKTATAIPTFTGILDSLPASAASYSVRRLSGTYTGSLIRVRRSSDNSEQDIGPTLGGNLNTTALTTFCGASSCFVMTWYDQSGNARDATQTTTANQPRIVNAGVLDTLNTIATLRFLATAFITGPAPMANSSELTLAFIARNDQFSTLSTLFQLNGDSPGPRIQAHTPWSDSNIYFDVGGASGAVRVFASSGITQSIAFQASFINSVSQATQSARINGTVRASDATGHSISVANFGLGYFLNPSATVTNRMNGAISEAIAFSSALSTTNRQNLENNQKAYFSTP